MKQLFFRLNRAAYVGLATFEGTRQLTLKDECPTDYAIAAGLVSILLIYLCYTWPML
jgi:hypothetical protein